MLILIDCKINFLHTKVSSKPKVAGAKPRFQLFCSLKYNVSLHEKATEFNEKYRR